MTQHNKFNVGDNVQYKQGDLDIVNWYGVIKKVVDLGNEYVYRIDAYAKINDKVVFDSEKTNEVYEAQLKVSRGEMIILLKSEYEKKGKNSDPETHEGSTKGTGALYEFFTPDEAVKKMWQLAYDNGFVGGNILEPALGSGRLLKYVPKDCKLTAIEISKDNIEMAKKTLSNYFTEIDFHNDKFETAFLEPERFNTRVKKGVTWLKQYPFDMVIANPPYGEFTGLYKTHFKFSGQFEHWFIEYSMKLVKSGGLGVFLVPSSFMRNGNTYNQVKERIFADSKLIDAYRLPANIFKKTQIGTDILILKKK